MTSAPSAQEIALACGVAGAYVDVTDDLVTDTISGSWGRTSGFTDTRPGVLSFDLVNDTGKYTPGNTGSSLATTVRIGMGVHHIVDGMHFGGTIRAAQPYFTGPTGLAGSSKIRITCDDMLGNAGRRGLASTLPDSLFDTSNGYACWALTDDPGSAVAQTTRGSFVRPATTSPSGFLTFGYANSGIPAEDSVVNLDPVPGGATVAFVRCGPTSIEYPQTTLGAWGCWVVRGTTATDFRLEVEVVGLLNNITIIADNTSTRLTPGTGTPVAGAVLAPGTPHYLSVGTSTTFGGGVWTITCELFIDGVSVGTSDYAQAGTVTTLTTTLRSQSCRAVTVSTTTALISRISHSPAPISEYLVADNTASGRLIALAATTPEIILDSFYSDLSPAPLANSGLSGSTLDSINEVVRTEQGHVWVGTIGDLLSPISFVKVRGRDRPAVTDSAHTFSINEILNAPDFATDIEDMVAAATARGPVAESTAYDSTLAPYVGSAADSTTVLLRDPIDLLSWAQDRLLRGKATEVRLTRITLDALQIDRWNDVSGLRPGDRVRVTDVPTQLGPNGYIDGWLLGCSYNLEYPSLQGEDRMLFTFYLGATLAPPALYDTSRYQAGGVLYLSSSIDSSVTSISVATLGATFTTSGADLPLNITVGSEVMAVTAATGATPQVFTVARGQAGTVAASHTAGDLVELTDTSLYAF